MVSNHLLTHNSHFYEKATASMANAIDSFNNGHEVELAKIKSRLQDIEAREENIISAIEDGLYSDKLKLRHKKLQLEKIDIINQIEELQTTSIDVPTSEVLASIVRTGLDELETLIDTEQFAYSKIKETIQDTIDEIIATPDNDNQELEFEIKGDFAGIVENWLNSKENSPSPENEEGEFIGGCGGQI